MKEKVKTGDRVWVLLADGKGGGKSVKATVKSREGSSRYVNIETDDGDCMDVYTDSVTK